MSTTFVIPRDMSPQEAVAFAFRDNAETFNQLATKARQQALSAKDDTARGYYSGMVDAFTKAAALFDSTKVEVQS